MSILSRFTDIMKANVGDRLKKSSDPLKAVNDILAQLNRDLGSVKAEAEAVLAGEERARRALDECRSEIGKLQRYAEKAVSSGEDETALRMLERKEKQVKEQNVRQAAYKQAAADADKLRRLADKLAADVQELSARRDALAAAHGRSGAEEQKDKANMALFEAEALAELKALRLGVSGDSLDAEIAALEQSGKDGGEAGAPAAEDPRKELEHLKANLNRNQSNS